jgi:hypothetical protein
MKFNITKSTEPIPKIGDIKKEIKFAFLPTRIDSKTIIWLERYVEVYEYTEDGASMDIYEIPGWELKKIKLKQ